MIGLDPSDYRRAAALRTDAGRGDPCSSGFRPRLSAEPKRDLTWGWIILLVPCAITVVLKATGAI